MVDRTMNFLRLFENFCFFFFISETKKKFCAFDEFDWSFVVGDVEVFLYWQRKARRAPLDFNWLRHLIDARWKTKDFFLSLSLSLTKISTSNKMYRSFPNVSPSANKYLDYKNFLKNQQIHEQNVKKTQFSIRRELKRFFLLFRLDKKRSWFDQNNGTIKTFVAGPRKKTETSLLFSRKIKIEKMIFDNNSSCVKSEPLKSKKKTRSCEREWPNTFRWSITETITLFTGDRWNCLFWWKSDSMN